MNDKLFESYKKLHQEGDLMAAKRGYLDILTKNPQHIDALHYLGVLAAEQEDYLFAEECLIKAIKLNATDPTLMLHLANIKKTRGFFADASQLLNKLIIDYPAYAAAHNNLGIVYYAEERLDEAIAAYQRAIDIQPNYADAYYNLALALTKAKRIEQATNVYHALLTLVPGHAGAHFHYGCLLMQQEKYLEAVEQFSFLDREHPNHFETQTNLATCHLQLNRLTSAQFHYEKALALSPQDSQVLFNLGVISLGMNRVQDAIQYYLSALKINPDDVTIQQNIGAAYILVNDKANALLHYREVLRLQPDNEVIAHTVKILMNDQSLTESPLSYIQSLFDSYAGHYESHVKFMLEYQVPQQLFAMVKKLGLLQQGKLDILDLGCGTGLCGELFKPYAHALTGIDLSEKMLAIASDKHCYDQLIQTDLLPFLIEHKQTYHLIVAGDVVVYFGKLSELMQAVYEALLPGGIFVFNVEVENSVNEYKPSSGRFAHSESYVRQVIHEAHFEICEAEESVLRQQNHEAVSGCLYVLRKGS